MNFPIPQFQLPNENHITWPSAFSEEECESIIQICETLEFVEGRTGSTDSNPKESTDKSIRNSNIVWLEPDADNVWVHKKYASIASRVNYDKFQLDLTCFDTIQYTKYCVGQHYNWHNDLLITPAGSRKLSFVTMLSDPSDYEGGDLLISPEGNPDRLLSVRLNKGDLVVFPSYVPHKVTPVTSGERVTLVAWALGPKLK